MSTKKEPVPQRGGSTSRSDVRERSEGNPSAGLSSGASAEEEAIFIASKSLASFACEVFSHPPALKLWRTWVSDQNNSAEILGKMVNGEDNHFF